MLLPQLKALELEEGKVAFLPLSSQELPLVIARVSEGVLLGGALSHEALDGLVKEVSETLLGTSEPLDVRVSQLQRAHPQGLVGRLVQGVVDPREALVERALKPPLQHLSLVAISKGEDLVARASLRNRALYGLLLGIFFTTFVVGVVLTARTLYREARLSRLKTDFVSLVSHELRTPLTSNRMFIDTLAMGRVQDPKEAQEVLSML
jgi:signal transduction histidine kinase